jgi:hypothetical protein
MVKLCISRCVPIALGTLVSTTASSMAQAVGYRLLATTKTSTMQKEMNEAADAGYRFGGVMGGDTAFGGSEVVTIMVRMPEAAPQYQYRLLATTKTSTMQKEMQAAGDAGFEYRGQTVFNPAFGGEEVVVILERDRKETPKLFEYRLLATSKTGTMQKELQDAGEFGFEFVGMTVAQTASGGHEIVVITRRARR